MKKQDLSSMGISELRALAKKEGIKADKGWKKEDFIKALSARKPPKAKLEEKAVKASKTKAKKAKPAPKITAKATKKVAAKITPKKLIKKAAAKKAAKSVKKEIKKPLEELTVAELKTLAKELGISLKSGLKKADIIMAIGKAKVKIEKPAPKKTKRAAAPKPVPVKKEKKAVKKVAVAKKPVKTIEKLPKVKKLPEKLKELPEMPEEPIKYLVPEEMPPLPEGYGENKLASMSVTPRQVYVYWEITEDTISRYPGSLDLKVINTKTNAFFYTPISERIGEQFISVSPAAEYTVEIGVINYKGEFVRILYSLPVETPAAGIAPAEVKEEAPQVGGLQEEFFEIPESISSY